jgi:hypothetical protein
MSDCISLYVDLLKHSVCGLIYEDPPLTAPGVGGIPTARFIRKFRELGRDMPSQAHTMIGLRRLNNLQACIEQVLADGVPGDLIETGVWRGGATIFMRGILKAHGVTDRTVWVADSFEGFPTPDLARFPLDAEWEDAAGRGVVTLETVRDNFARYGLLDDQVQFLKGWFNATLPAAPITQLAVMRLDGDLYESTQDALIALYPKLAAGGFVIIDDYNYASCRQAIQDFRAAHAIAAPIQDIDGFGAFWRKE